MGWLPDSNWSCCRLPGSPLRNPQNRRHLFDRLNREGASHSSDALRHSPVALSVNATHQTVGFIIAHDHFDLGIEVQYPAHARCDVPQVTQRRGQMPDFDVRIRAPATLDAVEEVAVISNTIKSSLSLVLNPEESHDS